MPRYALIVLFATAAPGILAGHEPDEPLELHDIDPDHLEPFLNRCLVNDPGFDPNEQRFDPVPAFCDDKKFQHALEDKCKGYEHRPWKVTEFCLTACKGFPFLKHCPALCDEHTLGRKPSWSHRFRERLNFCAEYCNLYGFLEIKDNVDDNGISTVGKNGEKIRQLACKYVGELLGGGTNKLDGCWENGGSSTAKLACERLGRHLNFKCRDKDFDNPHTAQARKHICKGLCAATVRQRAVCGGDGNSDHCIEKFCVEANAKHELFHDDLLLPACTEYCTVEPENGWCADVLHYLAGNHGRCVPRDGHPWRPYIGNRRLRRTCEVIKTSMAQACLIKAIDSNSFHYSPSDNTCYKVCSAFGGDLPFCESLNWREP